MDYARFVRLRRPLWDAFEGGLSSTQARPPRYAELEELAVRYRQVLHDHALARARYPGTAAARRLTGLALAGTHRLLVQDRTDSGGLGRFLTEVFPRAFRHHLPYLGLATALFAVSLVLGVCLSWVDAGVGLALLGPEAVAGMREGRLWTESLTTSVPPALSSSGIARNNMSVAVLAWAGGALAGLGALYVVVLNGFLLGAVMAATSHYGLTHRLLEFVSAHGPLEITLILVSAGGGLALGHALVGAHDRPRGERVAAAGRQAMLLLLGCLPWFVALGFVEGFLSPSEHLEPAFKLMLGLTLEAVFLVMALGPTLATAAGQPAAGEPLRTALVEEAR